MNADEILVIAVSSLFAGFIWFLNIRRIIRWWHWRSGNFTTDKVENTLPIEINDTPNNNSRYNTPKYIPMGIIKCGKHSINNKNRNEIKSFRDYIIPDFWGNHLKRIIRRLATKCKQNHFSLFLMNSGTCQSSFRAWRLCQSTATLAFSSSRLQSVSMTTSACLIRSSLDSWAWIRAFDSSSE